MRRMQALLPPPVQPVAPAAGASQPGCPGCSALQAEANHLKRALVITMARMSKFKLQRRRFERATPADDLMPKPS